MIKKILIGSAFLAITAVLVFGAIQRTTARTGEEGLAEGTRGQGGGAAWNSETTAGDQNPVDNEVRGGGRGGWSSETRGGGGWEQNAAEPEAEAAERSETHVDLSALVPGTLSQEETDGLLFMAEEEKLARDVYLAMYDLWGQATFRNIANSEQTHMQSVLDLLEGYGAAAPVLEEGQFANPDLQALYDQLIAQGSQSLTDALKVAAAIEEIDILDLRERSAQTDEEAILTVYASLESGSENHLRAFTRTLSRKGGEDYQPQYLSAAEYQRILGE